MSGDSEDGNAKHGELSPQPPGGRGEAGRQRNVRHRRRQDSEITEAEAEARVLTACPSLFDHTPPTATYATAGSIEYPSPGRPASDLYDELRRRIESGQTLGMASQTIASDRGIYSSSAERQYLRAEARRLESAFYESVIDANKRDAIAAFRRMSEHQRRKVELDLRQLNENRQSTFQKP